MAVVFVLLTAVVVVPLFDSQERTGLDRVFRIFGGIVLILLAALSAFGPGGRSAGDSGARRHVGERRRVGAGQPEPDEPRQSQHSSALLNVLVALQNRDEFEPVIR